MPGARKTAAQRAQEELDIATRLVERGEKRNATAQKDLEDSRVRYAALLETKEAEATAAAQALKDAKDRVEFYSSHPALAEGAGEEAEEPQDALI